MVGGSALNLIVPLFSKNQNYLLSLLVFSISRRPRFTQDRGIHSLILLERAPCMQAGRAS